jgi:hypothetical protein
MQKANNSNGGYTCLVSLGGVTIKRIDHISGHAAQGYKAIRAKISLIEIDQN